MLYSQAASGAELAVKNLERQKQLYDQSLSAKSYSDFRAAVFISKSGPTLAFSSVLFPDYGFSGEPLQDLRKTGKPFDLMTLSFAPMESEWAFVFAWHRESSRSCRGLLSTLAKAMLQGRRLEDALFGFVILFSENIAFSPTWWESRPNHTKEAIKEAASYGADLLSVPNPNFPIGSLNGISGWSFDSVISKYPPDQL